MTIRADDSDDDLFKRADDEDDASKRADAFDRTKFLGEVRGALDLDDPELRNRFVTGDWSAAADRSAARPRAEGEEDSDEGRRRVRGL